MTAASSDSFRGAVMVRSQWRHHTELIRTQQWLDEHLPALRLLASAGTAPVVKLLCPSRLPRDPRARGFIGGHLVRKATLRLTPAGRLTLSDSGGPGTVEDGWGGALDRSADADALGQPRVHLNCSKCQWASTTGQHRLLIAYLAALTHPHRECSIP